MSARRPRWLRRRRRRQQLRRVRRLLGLAATPIPLSALARMDPEVLA